MKMKIYIYLIIIGLTAAMMTACTEQPKADNMVAATACAYYEALLRGHYDQFVDGTYRPGSIPAGYREQLIANARMYIGQQQDEHHGIQRVRAVGAQADTANHVGTAYLEFTYGDSLREQVAVPMVCVRGVWYMR